MSALFALRWVFLAVLVAVVSWLSWLALGRDSR